MLWPECSLIIREETMGANKYLELYEIRCSLFLVRLNSKQCYRGRCKMVTDLCLSVYHCFIVSHQGGYMLGTVVCIVYISPRAMHISGLYHF